MVKGAPRRRLLAPPSAASKRRARGRRAFRLRMACIAERKEGREARGCTKESDHMRALVSACLAVLAGCIIDKDPVRVDNLTADTPATFTYDAWTNTVMTANDDGAA